MIIDAGNTKTYGTDGSTVMNDRSFSRIYSAYIKEVDHQTKTSAWGDVGKTSDLLHEFQSGLCRNRDRCSLIRTSMDRCLETGWIHSVAFSISGENLAWVSHNSAIYAVSSSNPSR